VCIGIRKGAEPVPYVLASRSRGGFVEVELSDEPIDLAGDVALDAADGFASSVALGTAPGVPVLVRSACRSTAWPDKQPHVDTADESRLPASTSYGLIAPCRLAGL
jgi:hypothetical protein